MTDVSPVDRGTDYDQGYEDGVRDGDASALLTAVEHRAAVAEAERDQLRDGIEKLCDEADIYLPPPSLILESLRALLAESGTPEEETPTLADWLAGFRYDLGHNLPPHPGAPDDYVTGWNAALSCVVSGLGNAPGAESRENSDG